MDNKDIRLLKKTRGVATYNKVIDTRFTELVAETPPETADTTPTVEEFFEYYDTLFFDIPPSGEINSHQYLIQRSQEFVGGSINDPEKQALIEEINSLKQQLLDLGQTFSTLNKITF